MQKTSERNIEGDFVFRVPGTVFELFGLVRKRSKYANIYIDLEYIIKHGRDNVKIIPIKNVRHTFGR